MTNKFFKNKNKLMVIQSKRERERKERLIKKKKQTNKHSKTKGFSNVSRDYCWITSQSEKGTHWNLLFQAVIYAPRNLIP